MKRVSYHVATFLGAIALVRTCTALPISGVDDTAISAKAGEGVKTPPQTTEASPASFATELNSLLAQPPGPLRTQAIVSLIGKWVLVDGPAAVVAAPTRRKRQLLS